jgi:sugar (pentulose or hexulose) kinase
MVHVRRRIEPDPERHEIYKFYVDQYINTYPPLQKMMQETVRHVAASQRQEGS